MYTYCQLAIVQYVSYQWYYSVFKHLYELSILYTFTFTVLKNWKQCYIFEMQTEPN